MLNNLTPDEAQNLRNYVASIGVELARIDAHADGPIGDEYCWMHDGDGNGGWTCRECRQRAEARARRRDFIRLMRRPEMVVFRKALTYVAHTIGLPLADIHELTVQECPEDFCFYSLVLSINEDSDNPLMILGHHAKKTDTWDFISIDVKDFVESSGLQMEASA